GRSVSCGAPLLLALERFDGGEYEVQAEVDEIDAGDGDRRVAGKHHAFVEQPIDELQQRGVGGRQFFHAGVACSRGSPPNRYAGQGPDRRTRYPREISVNPSRPTAAPSS